jgi:hypothetical protein
MSTTHSMSSGTITPANPSQQLTPPGTVRKEVQSPGNMATGTAVGSRGSIGAKPGGLVDTAVGRMELPVSYNM